MDFWCVVIGHPIRRNRARDRINVVDRLGNRYGLYRCRGIYIDGVAARYCAAVACAIDDRSGVGVTAFSHSTVSVAPVGAVDCRCADFDPISVHDHLFGAH